MNKQVNPIIIPIDKYKYVKICMLGKAKYIHEYYSIVEPTDDYIIFIKYDDDTYNIISTIEYVFKGE